MDDGSFIETETTKQNYEQLGKSKPQNPAIASGQWVLSYERLKFDTPSTKLSDGEYADIEGRYQYIKLPSKKECSIPSSSITRETLTQEAVDKIESNNT